VVVADIHSTTFALDGDVVVRLLCAAVLGGLVGVEREASDQVAGLRTHIAVALGAALFGVISTLGFTEFDRVRAATVLQVDVGRTASNVVVGIGFLGAGVIIRSGNHIRNLTTAASLWAVAAIGLACGVGDPTTAAVGTLVLLGSLVLLRPVRRLIRRRWVQATTVVRVELRQGVDPEAVARRFEDGDGITIVHLKVHKHGGQMVLESEVVGHPTTVRHWVTRLATADDVESVSED